MTSSSDKKKRMKVSRGFRQPFHGNQVSIPGNLICLLFPTSGNCQAENGDCERGILFARNNWYSSKNQHESTKCLVWVCQAVGGYSFPRSHLLYSLYIHRFFAKAVERAMYRTSWLKLNISYLDVSLSSTTKERSWSLHTSSDQTK